MTVATGEKWRYKHLLASAHAFEGRSRARLPPPAPHAVLRQDLDAGGLERGDQPRHGLSFWAAYLRDGGGSAS